MQAVVRGRKLRQQLSCARQAATYTDESSQQEAHDSDLDIDQMDDFLASLPDDEAAPPPAQASPLTLASPSLSACSLPLVSMPLHRHLSDSSRTWQAFSQPVIEEPAMQAGFSQHLEMRRASHARATTSSIPPARSLDTSLPALHPHSNISDCAASTAHLTMGNSTPLGRKQAQQQQQLPGFHLPSISPPIPQSTTPSSSSSFSLPPVFPHPINVSSPRTVDTTAPPIDSIEAAAAAGDGLRLSRERSARVSRASSSVRSEQSVGSLSPDRAAAKEQRHKVKTLLFAQMTCFASQGQNAA